MEKNKSIKYFHKIMKDTKFFVSCELSQLYTIKLQKIVNLLIIVFRI